MEPVDTRINLNWFADFLSRAAHTVAAGILILMMLLTASDVCLRYLFNRPIMGAYELTELMLVLLVFMSLAYTAFHDGHISLDLLRSHISDKAKPVLDCGIYLTGAGLFGLVTWHTVVYLREKMTYGDATEVLLIPIYPMVAIAALGSALLTFVYLSKMVQSLSLAVKKSTWWIWIGLVVSTGTALIFVMSPLWAPQLPRIDPLLAGCVGMVMLLVIIFAGLHVGLAMGIIGFAGISYLLSPEAAFSTLGATPFHTPQNYTLSTIPLFILMGMFAFHSGINRSLYRMIYKWLGHLPGGMAMATVGGCAGFAAISGSSVANAATMGTLTLPEMKRYGYDDRLATGSVAAGGTIGSMIPPSTGFIIYAFLTEQSISKLFMAGIIPGLLEALIYILTIYIICKFNPAMGPPGPRAGMLERFTAMKGVWPVGALFVLVLGGLYLGVFTPTEAAGVGAFGALTLSLFRRKLTWKNFVASLVDASKTTAMIFFIIIGATILGYFLAVTRLPFVLADIISGMPFDPWISFSMILLVYLVLGCVMDGLAMVLLTIPIFFPVVVALGFDPIWFGVIHLKIVEIGLITPPIGINVFVISGVAKDVPLKTIYRGVLPFVVADLIHLGLLLAFPALSLFLPNQMD